MKLRYVGTLNDDVIIAKGINYTDYVDKREIELTKEQYNTIPIPCKLVDGEFIPCDFPQYDVVETPKEEKTEAEKIEELQKKVDELQSELSALKQ